MALIGLTISLGGLYLTIGTAAGSSSSPACCSTSRQLGLGRADRGAVGRVPTGGRGVRAGDRGTASDREPGRRAGRAARDRDRRALSVRAVADQLPSRVLHDDARPERRHERVGVPMGQLLARHPAGHRDRWPGGHRHRAGVARQAVHLRRLVEQPARPLPGGSRVRLDRDRVGARGAGAVAMVVDGMARAHGLPHAIGAGRPGGGVRHRRDGLVLLPDVRGVLRGHRKLPELHEQRLPLVPVGHGVRPAGRRRRDEVATAEPPTRRCV